MKTLKMWGRALVAAFVVLALPAWAAQTGTTKTQAQLYDSFCDQCGAPSSLNIRNLIASVVLGAGGTTIDNTVIGGTTPAAGTFTTLGATGVATFSAGTASLPALHFGDSTTGFYKYGTNVVGVTVSTVATAAIGASVVGVNQGTVLKWSTSGSDPMGTTSTTLSNRDGANTLALVNATTAQSLHVYASTTGPVHVDLTARTAGGVMTATGGAMQLSFTQTTPPTCGTNCGSPGNVCVGSDTSMICTMGTTPSSGFIITFNGTWPAAPSCAVTSALTSMVVGKMAIAAQASQTTLTITTNGTAPVAADQYAIICHGVS